MDTKVSFEVVKATIIRLVRFEERRGIENIDFYNNLKDNESLAAEVRNRVRWIEYYKDTLLKYAKGELTFTQLPNDVKIFSIAAQQTIEILKQQTN